LTGATQVLQDSFQRVPLIGGVAGFLIGLVTSLLLNTLVFALLFKFLPNTVVRWGDVWLGALVTAVLWEIGKNLLALYIGRSGQSWSAYGVVGTVLILMAWIYFSSQILFLGRAGHIHRGCAFRDDALRSQRDSCRGATHH
jgi:membrane protein